ncbi:nucleoside diphosphate kinase regulator [Isoalcanivorax indicus]|uniref:nucleoside diphosphate kinase regulator n=1 Tax=Isoalcanivorax indicus TaxID=2202653 RepID=UPI000DB938D3|nr:nucleoside diphosphate kinase regulator [Isoalcanivorax indicus]
MPAPEQPGLPAITVSTRDSDRLYALLDRLDEPADVIEALYGELERARTLLPEEMPDDVVTLGSRARFENETTGKVQTLTLLLPAELDGSPGQVSVLAPAGAALLGLRVGDRIDWPSGHRTLRLHLVEVAQPPHS